MNRYFEKQYQDSAIVEAIQCAEALSHAQKNWQGLPPWLNEMYEKGEVIFCPNKIELCKSGLRLEIPENDWLIKRTTGGLSIVSGDVFHERYRLLE